MGCYRGDLINMATLKGTLFVLVIIVFTTFAIVFNQLQLKMDLQTSPLLKRRSIEVRNNKPPLMKVCSQSQRLTHLREVCSKRNITPYQSTLPFYKDYSNILVDEKHKLLWCIIGKTGTNSLRNILSGSIVKHKPPYANLEGMKWLRTIPVQQRYEKIKSYYKIILVRNPLYRLISCWDNKFRYLDHNITFKVVMSCLNIFEQSSSENIGYLPKKEGGAIVSFNTFLKFVNFALTDGRVFNNHWSKYHELCHPCEIEYDLILK